MTDTGLEGLSPAGGGRAAQALVEGSFKELLVGENPLHIEKIWDDLFWCIRGVGRKGLAFCALSAVDIALWDLKAKHFNVPLYQLLGTVHRVRTLSTAAVVGRTLTLTNW